MADLTLRQAAEIVVTAYWPPSTPEYLRLRIQDLRAALETEHRHLVWTSDAEGMPLLVRMSDGQLIGQLLEGWSGPEQSYYIELFVATGRGGFKWENLEDVLAADGEETDAVIARAKAAVERALEGRDDD